MNYCVGVFTLWNPNMLWISTTSLSWLLHVEVECDSPNEKVFIANSKLLDQSDPLGIDRVGKWEKQTATHAVVSLPQVSFDSYMSVSAMRVVVVRPVGPPKDRPGRKIKLQTATHAVVSLPWVSLGSYMSVSDPLVVWITGLVYSHCETRTCCGSLPQVSHDSYMSR